MLIVQCPHCLAFETLDTLPNGDLRPTKKFRQAGDHIYHDCGTDRACRVLWNYGDIKEDDNETED